MDIDAFLPAILVIVGALGAGLAGILGVWMTYLQSKAKKRAEFQMMKDNARLATQAAEQLGTTNDERRQIAMILQAKWNKDAGLSFTTDVNLNEGNVPTIVKVPVVNPTSVSPDPTALG